MANRDWRAEDANEGQIVALRRHGGEYRKGMTAGEASDAIKKALAYRRYEKVKEGLDTPGGEVSS
jgi:hypothetical protein